MRFNPKRNPSGLPYRNVAECYLLYHGRIVAQIAKGGAGKYMSIPGGGIDRGETPECGARRELKEELGAVLRGPLRRISVVEWDWNPEWANTEKRKGRYMQFRGERVYSFIGEVERFNAPTSDEGDAWKGSKTMPLKTAATFMQNMYEKHSLPNQREYNAVKCNIISTLSAVNMMKKAPKTRKEGKGRRSKTHKAGRRKRR